MLDLIMVQPIRADFSNTFVYRLVFQRGEQNWDYRVPGNAATCSYRAPGSPALALPSAKMRATHDLSEAVSPPLKKGDEGGFSSHRHARQTKNQLTTDHTEKAKQLEMCS